MLSGRSLQRMPAGARPGVGTMRPVVGGQQLSMSRLFRAGAFRFFVGSTDPTIVDDIERLLLDLPTDDEPDGEMQVFSFIPSPSEPGRWDAHGPVVGVQTGLTRASAITLLITGVNLGALATEPERLHLHAGAAVRSGQAVVMSAARETGKTTTLARLVLRGWEFISDEAISIGRDDPLVTGFAKPLSIKPRGRHLVPELEAHFTPPLSQVTDDEVVHVALGAVGGRPVPAAHPHLLVFLRREAEPADGGRPVTHPVHPVDAVVRLMTETMDAGRYGARAVVELAHLAARCRCAEVQIGDPEATGDLIEELAAAPASDALPVVEIGVAGRLRPHVVSVLIDDRVVIHEPPEGSILALDPMATQIWLTLAGRNHEEPIDLEGPVVARFVEQLVALGLVAPHEAGAR